MAIAWAIRSDMRPEQDRAIALGPIVIGKIPLAFFIKLDQRVHPSGAVKIRPLVGKAQMRFDDRAADRLQIEHASIAGKIFLDPLPARLFDAGVRFGVNDPMVEGPLARRFSGDVPPPAWCTLRYRH